jgi:hypothetical protein
MEYCTAITDRSSCVGIDKGNPEKKIRCPAALDRPKISAIGCMKYLSIISYQSPVICIDKETP